MTKKEVTKRKYVMGDKTIEELLNDIDKLNKDISGI
jgi:hypothetical protein